MKLLIAMFVLAVSVQAAEPPAWLSDLRQVYYVACAPAATCVGTTAADPLPEIKRIAQAFATEEGLNKALLVLPSKERRDAAYKTLISFTRWQPQPGLTADGAHGGHPAPGK